MKIIDFDGRFYEYAAKWVAAHPGLTDAQLDESYNAMMREWMDRPADWLDGQTPARYFDAFSDPDELMDMICAYAEQEINIPEPLYTRIVSLGEACADRLHAILRDTNREDILRAEALGMLRDIGTHCADDTLIQMVVTCAETDELCDMAADALCAYAADVEERLLDAYPDAPDCAKAMILDICVNAPTDERIYTYLVHRLKNCPEARAQCAAMLEKLDDDRAIEPLQRMLALFDITYYDYMAIRNAVEALGGDIGEERAFYGDPDYEALRATEE